MQSWPPIPWIPSIPSIIPHHESSPGSPAIVLPAPELSLQPRSTTSSLTDSSPRSTATREIVTIPLRPLIPLHGTPLAYICLSARQTLLAIGWWQLSRQTEEAKNTNTLYLLPYLHFTLDFQPAHPFFSYHLWTASIRSIPTSLSHSGRVWPDILHNRSSIRMPDRRGKGGGASI